MDDLRHSFWGQLFLATTIGFPTAAIGVLAWLGIITEVGKVLG